MSCAVRSGLLICTLYCPLLFSWMMLSTTSLLQRTAQMSAARASAAPAQRGAPLQRLHGARGDAQAMHKELAHLQVHPDRVREGDQAPQPVQREGTEVDGAKDVPRGWLVQRSQRKVRSEVLRARAAVVSAARARCTAREGRTHLARLVKVFVAMHQAPPVRNDEQDGRHGDSEGQRAALAGVRNLRFAAHSAAAGAGAAATRTLGWQPAP